jgi:DNA helicase-2/ATP-dependent DNA helicase PcrA
MARQYTLQRHAPAGPRIDFEKELNPQQCAAVTAGPGPALVIAGAGSGKTRTLTYRVAYLIENGVQPSNILLLTFTNKAAREMLNRVADLIPHDITTLWGGTFHSVGNRILRRHAEAAGFSQGFSIMDREDQQDLLDGVIVALGVDPKEKRFPKGEVLADVISFALNTGRTIEQVVVEKYPHFLEFAPQIMKAKGRYEERKRAANSLDFDDLLEKSVKLLRENKSIAEHYQRQFQFILVDEYQDTNLIQSEFIDTLGSAHGNIMVVGDDAQSIYSWRGANFKNILDFPRRYPQAVIYKIETNYRSAPDILDVANAAIAANVHQFKKELVAARAAAPVKPGLVPLGDSNQQALFVTQRILDLREEGVDLNEVAVLYRAHYHSMELQMELTRHGVPFQITSGLRFFEQAHIKDVAAFLKFAVNPRDEVAFKRMVRLLPGIGARSAEQLWSEVEKRYLQLVPPPTEGSDVPQKMEGLYRELLLPLKVSAKSRKAWEQLAYTLDEIAPGGIPHPPAEMIASILEAIYDEYLKAKFLTTSSVART